MRVPLSLCVLFYGALCKLPKDWKQQQQHGQSALRVAALRAMNYYCLVPHAAAASRYAAPLVALEGPASKSPNSEK